MKCRHGLVALCVLALLVLVAPPPVTQAQAPVVTFNGTGNGRVFLGPFNLHAGLVTVTARHSGTQNFTLGLILPKPGVNPLVEYQQGYGMINVAGSYDGGAATNVTDAGAYVLDLFASGAYQITVEQPAAANPATAGQREFAGHGQQITPIFVLGPGPHRIQLTHNGRSNFQVWLYHLNGAAVSGDVFGRIVNIIGPYNDTVALEIVADGPHLFHVNADGDWTIKVTAPAAPTPTPTPAGTVTPTPTYLGVVAQFRGTANNAQLLGPFDLGAGLVVIRARHGGQGNFSAGLLLPKPGVDPRREYQAGYGVINVIGQYNGGGATTVTDAGSYVLDLTASGSYEITVEQYTGATQPAQAQTQFSGHGQQVTPIFGLAPGAHRLILTHAGNSNFQVWLYDLNGTQQGGDVFGRLVNVIGPYNDGVPLDAPAGGPFLFHVNADGDWTLKID